MAGIDSATITKGIADARALLAQVKADPAKYQDMLAKSADAFAKVQGFISHLAAGDTKAAEITLTRWGDVNATLLAAAEMAAINEDDKKGITLAKVGAVAEDVLAVVEKLGPLVPIVLALV